jgi:hypothetical protein
MCGQSWHPFSRDARVLALVPERPAIQDRLESWVGWREYVRLSAEGAAYSSIDSRSFAMPLVRCMKQIEPIGGEKCGRLAHLQPRCATAETKIALCLVD